MDSKTWAAAQKLVTSGYFNLGFKMVIAGTNHFVFPSTVVLKDQMPADCKTTDEKLGHLKTWAKKFIALVKKPRTYNKLANGDWDFEVLSNMVFSFWIVKEITGAHPRAQLFAEAGIVFECSCPQYVKKAVCKHCVGYGLFTKRVKVPLRFSATVAGKRKAPAGATLSKRSKALEIDG